MTSHAAAQDPNARNRERYCAPEIVRHYAEYDAQLQPPEETIRSLLLPRLAGMRMLDVGVGAGRTTPFFAPLVKSYTAVDFAAPMVETCRRRYAGQFPSARFETADARDLSRYPGGAFEFVLFSFNGIDNVAAEDRGRTLGEMRRVCAPGGCFAFSSHNLLRLEERRRLPLHWHPLKLIAGIAARQRLISRNREAFARLADAQETSIYDDVFDVGLTTHYIRPTHQVRMLRAAGFGEVRVFGLRSGRELAKEAYERIADPWLYYLCR